MTGNDDLDDELRDLERRFNADPDMPKRVVIRRDLVDSDGNVIEKREKVIELG